MVAAAVIVHDAEGVLLLRRAQHDLAHGRWILPGGFVNRGEAVPAAARREVREELGVEVELGRLVGVYSFQGEAVITIVYEGRPVEGAVRAGDEALEVRSFALDAIPWGELGFPSTVESLRQLVSEGELDL